MANSTAIVAVKRSDEMMRMALLMSLVLCPSLGCGLIGPSCLERRKTGPVATVSGEVGAGAITFHQVPYGIDGSQNDADIRWSGDSAPSGPRIQVYATRLGCIDFNPAQTSAIGCDVLGGAGWFDGNVARTLVITHGRGNPEVLGSPPEYKLWIVGDPQQHATYTINITWFYGPDC